MALLDPIFLADIEQAADGGGQTLHGFGGVPAGGAGCLG